MRPNSFQRDSATLEIQYAIAPGLHVAAVDVDDLHLGLAKKLGARVTVNAKQVDPVAVFEKMHKGQIAGRIALDFRT